MSAFRRALALLICLLPALAGCLTGSSDPAPLAPGASSPELEVAGEAGDGDASVVTLEAEGGATLGAYDSTVDGRPAEFEVTRGGPAKATLVATWTPTTPAGETLYIQFSKRVSVVIEAEGKSPLTIEIPVDTMKEPGPYVAWAYPTQTSVMVNEKVDFVLTLEYEDESLASTPSP